MSNNRSVRRLSNLSSISSGSNSGSSYSLGSQSLGSNSSGSNSSGSNLSGSNLSGSISDSNSNASQITPIIGRNVVFPSFVNNVAEGTITGGNAEAELVLPGQLLGRNNQMVGITRASKLKPQWVTRRPLYNHYVSVQGTNAMEQGTICMIDKNGTCIPIGHTDPQHTTRSTENMRREFQEIMADPASTLPDVQRAQQLLRMVHRREAQEYLERRELERERERERSIYRLAQHGTRRFRNGALSGLRRMSELGGVSGLGVSGLRRMSGLRGMFSRGVSGLRGMFSRGRVSEARANEARASNARANEARANNARTSNARASNARTNVRRTRRSRSRTP